IMNTWFNQNQNEMILESNIFRNNVSNYGGIYVVLNSGQPNLDLSVNNNVFEGNEAIDTDTAGYGASSIWLRPITVNTSINATIANNTFFANRDAGTNSVGTNLSTIAIDEGQGASFNGVIANSIFWNNTDGSGTLNDVISTNLSNTAVGTLEVRNSTSDLGFANLSQPTLFNTSSGDPLFVNSAVGNFNLQDSSPARNTGDASFSNFIPTDIEGKPRLIGIIDQGAYENQTVVSTFDLTITTVGNGTVTPSSGTTFNSGDTANLTATPDTGWQFDGWSGDLTSTNTSETLVMDADKTVTATFSEINYAINVNVISGNGSFNISPAGPYNNGDMVTITATADANFQFMSFSGDVSSTTNPFTFTLGAQDYDINLSFSPTLGVANTDKIVFKLYPNPTSTAIHIKTTASLEQVAIYNLIGQKVLSSQLNTIDVSTLSNGVYLVKMITADGRSTEAKFIKK
ncbi:InlB B-repeat-containing protein, partial [Psychroserpens sp.]|uniref:InlB B-repeat-containing protein n=1 Tax=Psychroserpens sp. TaxID=2020870 RepID=UPI003C76FA84